MIDEPKRLTEAGSSPVCPRDGLRLVPDHEEGYPHCLTCGHYDYKSGIIPKRIGKRLTTLVRYVGSILAYKDIVLETWITHAPHRFQAAEMFASCPWCDDQAIMQQAELTGTGKRWWSQRDGWRASLLVCPSGHKLFVFTCKRTGAMEWLEPDPLRPGPTVVQRAEIRAIRMWMCTQSSGGLTQSVIARLHGFRGGKLGDLLANAELVRAAMGWDRWPIWEVTSDAGN